MNWKFDDRPVNGWPVTGLFDDDHLILGATGFTAPEGSYKRQIEAVPEMLELLNKLAHAYDASQSITQRDALFLDLSIAAEHLVAKIEGGKN